MDPLAATQVLTTKLYPPPPRPYLVARPRLIERMNGGLQAGRRLILVSANAGFGKTTLTGEWIHTAHLQNSVAWVSLGPDDNDPTRFLMYLVAALQQVDPRIGENILPALHSSQPAPLTELVAQVINQIDASGKAVNLMLDDYHLVTSQAVHEIVQLIIDRQPVQMHTVILTREDPPFPLPRMRVCGQVTEIRERDLRFTLPEAQAFLIEAMGLELSAQDVGRLKERTEGWVAGMQLAALALEDYLDENSRREFIDAFTGSDRFIVDYLVSEVLARQPEPIRQFLMDTSVLERFCAELCDQVTYGGAGVEWSQSILDRLETGNLFLVPLDNHRQWYRYHHLFSEMLSHSLSRSTPERIPELHRRASAWFASKGLISEAVKHALTSQDWDYFRGLLDRHAMRVLTQGQSSQMIEWCGAFPREQLDRMPEICIYFAWGLVLTFRNDFLDAVEEKLQLAERLIQAEDIPAEAGVGPGGARVPFRDWVIGQACVIRSQLLLARYNRYIDPQELIALSHKGLDLLPTVEKAIRAICIINLAHAQTMQNNPLEGQKAFEETLPAMLEGNNYLTAVTCIFYLARLAYYLGDLERAEALCLEWKAKYAAITDHPALEIPATRGMDIVLALLRMERGDFDEAERLLVQALEIVGWGTWMELHGFILLARLRHLRGDHAGVEEVFRRMENLGPQHASCAEALRNLFWARTCLDDPVKRAKIEAWANNHVPDLDKSIIPLGIGPYHSDAEYIHNLTWAQVQVIVGNPQAALTFLEPALKSAREHNLLFRIIELSVAQALAEEARAEHPAALAILEDAVRIAEPYGYVRVFDDGKPLDGLLAEISSRGMYANTIQRLRAASYNQRSDGVNIGNEPGGSPTGRPANSVQSLYPSLVEPLSEREFDVLRLIAAGCSNIQIGERLFIAQGTVKRHITNLYGKLGVQTRTQAIVRAREVGLIQ
jgi:LuxR family transcriptional regulator, maltose regulon positive regulatory protein